MELLKKLTQCYGPSGREDQVRELIKLETEKYADEMYTDTLGNLIVRKGSGGKKIVILSLETIFFLHKILVLYETLTIWHPIYSACLNFVKVSLEYRNVFSRLILPEVIQVHDFTHHL